MTFSPRPQSLLISNLLKTFSLKNLLQNLLKPSNRCGACYSVELRNNHVCVPNSMQRDCPICYEYLFDSLEAPQVRE